MRGSLRVIIAALTALPVTFGCRGIPQPAPAPSAHELCVGQLRFVSDFQLREDNPLVRELADERQDVYDTLGLPSGNEQITVYLFRDAQHYGEFLSRYFPSVPSRRAFFLETDTALTVYAHWSDRFAEDLRHEVAHGYLHAVAPGLPLWLDEGLAEYFEVPRGNGGLNRPHLDLLADMTEHEGWRPDLARLEQLKNAAAMEQLDYAESWAWVYFLLHSDSSTRELLTNYLTDVRTRGNPEPLSTRLAEYRSEPEQQLALYLDKVGSQQTRSASASGGQGSL
jgi:hypothetical protein